MGYVVVFSQNLGGGRSANIQFNFAQGATEKDWNVEFDKFSSIFDRQVARADLAGLENQLKAQELVAEVIAKDIVKLEASMNFKTHNIDPTKRNPETGAREAAAIGAQKDALEAANRKALELRKIIDETRKKAA